MTTPKVPASCERGTTKMRQHKDANGNRVMRCTCINKKTGARKFVKKDVCGRGKSRSGSGYACKPGTTRYVTLTRGEGGTIYKRKRCACTTRDNRRKYLAMVTCKRAKSK